MSTLTPITNIPIQILQSYRSEVSIQYESIHKKNADFKRFFFFQSQYISLYFSPIFIYYSINLVFYIKYVIIMKIMIRRL